MIYHVQMLHCHEFVIYYRNKVMYNLDWISKGPIDEFAPLRRKVNTSPAFVFKPVQLASKSFSQSIHMM